MTDIPVYRLSKIEHALIREGWIAQGRFDAFTFAAKVQGDSSLIEAEIESREVDIREALKDSSMGRENATAPGASPRIYSDAYIAGLRAALAMIQRMTQDEQAP